MQKPREQSPGRSVKDQKMGRVLDPFNYKNAKPYGENGNEKYRRGLFDIGCEAEAEGHRLV